MGLPNGVYDLIVKKEEKRGKREERGGEKRGRERERRGKEGREVRASTERQKAKENRIAWIINPKIFLAVGQ